MTGKIGANVGTVLGYKRAEVSDMIDVIRELIFYKGGWFVAKMFILLAVIVTVLIMFMCELMNIN